MDSFKYCETQYIKTQEVTQLFNWVHKFIYSAILNSFTNY